MLLLKYVRKIGCRHRSFFCCSTEYFLICTFVVVFDDDCNFLGYYWVLFIGCDTDLKLGRNKVRPKKIRMPPIPCCAPRDVGGTPGEQHHSGKHSGKIE